MMGSTIYSLPVPANGLIGDKDTILPTNCPQILVRNRIIYANGPYKTVVPYSLG